MNSVTEDTLLLHSEYCSDHDTQMTQGKIRPSRREKKVKGEAKVGLKKRRLSDEQVKLLEMSFDSERTLESARKDRLARELDLDSRQVAVWFQNRRVRWKTKRLEEELLRLKAVNESVVVEKCKLEEEILKLRMRLSEAESELRKLSENSDGVWEGERSSSRPSSSLSMNGHKPLLGDLGDIFYAPESNYCYINGMDEWMNLYGSMII